MCAIVEVLSAEIVLFAVLHVLEKTFLKIWIIQGKGREKIYFLEVKSFNLCPFFVCSLIYQTDIKTNAKIPSQMINRTYTVLAPQHISVAFNV